jgi:hypothetical protein
VRLPRQTAAGTTPKCGRFRAVPAGNYVGRASVAQTAPQPLTPVWATRLFDGKTGPVDQQSVPFFTHTQSEEQIETDSVALC